MARVFVKPVHEIMRDPVTRQPLPKEGAWVDDAAEQFFWRKRINQGDVTEVNMAEANAAVVGEPAP